MAFRNYLLHLIYFWLTTVVVGQAVTDKAEILRDCASATDLKINEWMDYLHKKIATEKILCTLKCMHQKEGSLGENGKWNVTFMEEKLSSMLLVKNSGRKQIMDCITNLPPVHTCEGVLDADKCITEMKVKNCSHDSNITMEDGLNYRKDIFNPSEKMMCYLKCTAEIDDVISSSGEINTEFLNKIVDSGRFMNKEMKEKVKECFSKVPPIKSCLEYKPFHLCTLDMRL